MATLEWPEGFAPVGCYFDLIDQSVVYTDPRTKSSLRMRRAGATWEAQFTMDELEPCQWPVFAAFIARLRGSVNSVRLWDFSDEGVLAADVVSETTFDDDTVFDDGFGFDGGTGVMLAEDGALGATTLVIAVSQDDVLTEGRKIGLPNDRLYLVDSAPVVDPESGLVTVTVWPPLKEAVVAGTIITTFRPTTVFFRMGADPIMRSLEKFGTITLNFSQEVQP